MNLNNLHLESFLDMLPIAAVVYDNSHKIKHVNSWAQQAFNKSTKFLITDKIDKLIDEATVNKKTLVKTIEIESQFYQYYIVPVSHEHNKTYKAIIYFDSNVNIQKDYEVYKQESEDLKALFESSYDVLYVSDDKGNTLRVSSSCKHFWGEDPENLIGKNVIDLESQGVYTPSITRLVLEKGDKISTIQTTKNNKRLLVVGTPIKDEEGKIIRVVNASRDITEIELLNQEVEDMKEMIAAYQLEIAQLQYSMHDNQKIVYQSKVMEDVMALAKRLAKVNSTILILGESGVGKEFIANYIHELSMRSDKPLVKVNCSAIPEHLLEYELFGYEKGAFPGANKEGKMGLFEFANDGTLFLDEIADIPYVLQAKLLRVLQENEINRLGSTKPTKINVRIIASTNKNLLDMVKKGDFREDLYYRLNVVPLQLPPLRERKGDILPLAQFFISYFNKKYNKKKFLSLEFANALEQYQWPGNIRELRNLIERAIVTVEEEEISPDLIALLPIVKPEIEEAVIVNKILPLKECIEIAERKLLKLTLEKYKTTTEIAKILNVNQSTISRKISKLKS